MIVRILSIVAISLSLAGSARADSTEARKHYDRGMRAYNLQDFKGALTEFQRAYVEMPDAAFLFNIGQAQRQLGQYDAASKSFHLYLANQPDATNREQVEHLIQQMDKAAADARTKEPTPIGVQRHAVSNRRARSRVVLQSRSRHRAGCTSEA